MATGADVTHEELQSAFFPLGEWPDKDTRDRIDFIIGEGLQADPELIRQGLPQSLRAKASFLLRPGTRQQQTTTAQRRNLKSGPPSAARRSAWQR